MVLFDGIHSWETNLNDHEIELLKRDIDSLIDEAKDSQLFILNPKRDQQCFLEYVVDQLAKFHIKQKNDNYDDYVFEFWFKRNTAFNVLHCDKDEEKFKKEKANIHPEMASILYLDDNVNPTFISEVKETDLMFKDFDGKNKCCLSFPRKGRQTTFDGSYFHGAISKESHNTSERYILLINFWKKYIPTCSEYFDFNVYSELKDYSPLCDELKAMMLTKQSPCNYTTNQQSVFDYVFHESLHYNIPKSIVDKDHRFKTLIELIEDKLPNESLIYVEYSKNYRPYESINDNVTSIVSRSQKFFIDNLKVYLNREETNKDVHRFQQRYIESQFVSIEDCQHIIDVSESYATANNGWTTNRHGSYPTTDLPVKKISDIEDMTANISCKVMKINDFYQLSGLNIQFFIDDMFIVKYEFDESRDIQRGLDLHADGSLISFQVLLNKSTDFEGGGTYFSDGLIHYPNQGDLCIHYSRIKHAGIPITKGKRYLLVGFIGYKL